MLGSLITGSAPNLGVLILGRLLYGTGIGLVSITIFFFLLVYLATFQDIATCISHVMSTKY